MFHLLSVFPEASGKDRHQHTTPRKDNDNRHENKQQREAKPLNRAVSPRYVFVFHIYHWGYIPAEPNVFDIVIQVLLIPCLFIFTPSHWIIKVL